MTQGETLVWIALISAVQVIVLEWIRRGASRSSRQKVIEGVSHEIRKAADVIASRSEVTPTSQKEFPKS